MFPEDMFPEDILNNMLWELGCDEDRVRKDAVKDDTGDDTLPTLKTETANEE